MTASRPGTVAVILAGGLSSRMGQRFKPLLPLAGRTPLSWLAGTFRQAGLDHILVVTGYRGTEVAAEATRLGLTPVHNPDYETGMFSSVRAGLTALPQGTVRVCIIPVDVPLFRAATVRRLLARAQEPDTPPLLYPVFMGERGHPPLIAASVVPEVLAHHGEGGLRQALAPFAFEEIAVADAAILADMDTPNQYASLCALAERLDCPTPAEAEALLAIQGVPPQGLAHGRGVAAVAMALGRALNDAGLDLDISLIKASALLHDVAKGQPHHEAAGGQLLDALGFHRAAAIVAAHRDAVLPDSAPITEREIVYLADKFVFGRWLVPVQLRFQQKLDLFAADPEATAAIRRRLGNAQNVLARVEARLNAKAEDVIAAAGFHPGPPPAEAYEAARKRGKSAAPAPCRVE